MKHKSKKIPKRQQNSIFWVYGYHATVAALRNPNRRKSELLLTTDAQKRVTQEKDFEVLNTISWQGIVIDEAQAITIGIIEVATSLTLSVPLGIASMAITGMPEEEKLD